MKIVDFYKQILSAGSLVADAAGNVSAMVESKTIPFTVGSKRMVLPTKEQLANPNKDNVAVFHPLEENIIRGESEVMTRYRAAVNLRLNYVINHLLLELITLSTSPGMHSKLTPNHYDLLAHFKDADEKTIQAFEALMKAMPMGSVEKCFAHIFIKKNAIIGGKTYRRGAMVSFPLYEELEKEGTTVYGVKLRKKDHAAFKGILKQIFPDMDIKNHYSRGSASDIAATLDCLLAVVINLASYLNGLIDEYGDLLEDIKSLRYEDEWMPEMANLTQFTNELRLMPMQTGNEGSHEVAAAPAPVGQLQNVAPPALPQPVMVPAPSYTYAAPPVSAPVTQSGLLDFGAMLRNNPQLAPQMPGYPMGMPPGPAAARMAQPRWAGPQQQMQPTYGYQQPYAPQMSYPTGRL